MSEVNRYHVDMVGRLHRGNHVYVLPTVAVNGKNETDAMLYTVAKLIQLMVKVESNIAPRVEMLPNDNNMPLETSHFVFQPCGLNYLFCVRLYNRVDKVFKHFIVDESTEARAKCAAFNRATSDYRTQKESWQLSRCEPLGYGTANGDRRWLEDCITAGEAALDNWTARLVIEMPNIDG